MNRGTKTTLLALIGGLIVASGVAAWFAQRLMTTPVRSAGCLVVGTDLVASWTSESGADVEAEGWTACTRWMNLRGYAMKPGRYCPDDGETARSFARKLAIGGKTEVNVVVPAHRDLGTIAEVIARPLALDSAAVHAAIAPDSVWWRIVPNTYRMYWSTTADELVARLRKEHEHWWTPERLAQAEAAELTPHEATTLAAIVQEEIAVRGEAKRVAGLYRNRLAQNMRLQADPTLKFALGNWGIKRLLNADKSVDSPYNTYLHAGLPPGPIRVPEPDIIDAVLQAERHDYLFMCAKPDGSGTHAFAANYGAHQRNANAYRQWLNARKIFR